MKKNKYWSDHLSTSHNRPRKAWKAKAANTACSRVAEKGDKQALAVCGKIELELRAHPVANTGDSDTTDHTKVKFSFPSARMFPERNAACLSACRWVSVYPDCLSAIGVISFESEKAIMLTNLNRRSWPPLINDR